MANVFETVLFTLLLQGLTTKPLLKLLNLIEDRSLQQKYLELIARRDALNHVLQHLTREAHPDIEAQQLQQQIALLEAQLATFQQDINRLRDQHPALQVLSSQTQQDKLLALEMSVYQKYVQAGLLEQPLLPMLPTKAVDIRP